MTDLSTSAQPHRAVDIRAARERIAGKVHHTPVMTSTLLNLSAGGPLYFKCENFQKAGSFKARGATNAVFALSSADATRGVVTHSSGNHGAALARAAGLRQIPAHIVMPSNAPRIKQAAVLAYGGKIVFCEPTQAAREAGCARIMAETGATLVHPYNDHTIMAGQGTAAAELLDEVPDLDLILVPVGGGGLLSGTAVAAKGMRPAIQVFGIEPEQADDASQSFKAGRVLSTTPNTIADGLRTTLGPLNFPIIQSLVDDIVTVSEASIIAAMRQVWETMKLVIEPSAAVPLAALLYGRIALNGRRAGVILSGGNLDLDALPWTAR